MGKSSFLGRGSPSLARVFVLSVAFLFLSAYTFTMVSSDCVAVRQADRDLFFDSPRVVRISIFIPNLNIQELVSSQRCLTAIDVL